MAARVIWMLVPVMLVACGADPTTPTGSSKPQPPPPLWVRCVPAAQLICTAEFGSEGDVTARAIWSAAESYEAANDLPLPASNVVEFIAPGVVRALRPGTVYIRADYVSPNWPNSRFRSPALFAFAMDPAGPAVPLTSLSGSTFIAGTTTILTGVTLEIIEGEGAGKRLTAENGYYRFDFLRLSSPFAVRASKPGYVAAVQAHGGITMRDLTYPVNNTLHFYLVPQ